MSQPVRGFDQLLVPVDGSDESLRALPPARTIADFVGADLVVASVVAKPTDREPMEAKLRARLGNHGVPVSRTVVVVNGYSVGQGLDALVRDPGVLVVVATAGHRRTVGLTGSVAEQLVHARPQQPTLLVGPHADVRGFDLAGPMIVCRDPEQRSPGVEELAERVGAKLLMRTTIVSVLPPRRTDVYEVDRMTSGPAPEVESVALRGSDRARTIVDYASDLGASLIAVGTRRRDGLSRMIFGSVAIQTVSEARCPVLVVPT